MVRTLHLGAAYPVTLPVFEGPLELLLALIEREELDINTISLVAVTDQYLATLQNLREIEPGALADFLVVASQLLLIKSSRLLPSPAHLQENEENLGDNLIQQLLEYRQYKQAAAELRVREELGVRVYVRAAPPPELESAAPIPLELINVDAPRLHAALLSALQRMPPTSPLPTVQPYLVTVAEQIEVVRRQLDAVRTADGAMQPVRFSEIVVDANGRMEVVVTFLAVLELVKQQELVAVQRDTFGEIWLAPAPHPEQRAAAETGAAEAERAQQQ
jgi:segregation and condensation protein A